MEQHPYLRLSVFNVCVCVCVCVQACFVYVCIGMIIRA